MSKKERMLNYITSNVNWFMSTSASVDVIPYSNMSDSVFSRVDKYIVSGYVDKEDVVCLISTSVLKTGKTGILFTTDKMYCKSWGPLTKKHYNYYYEYGFPSFDYYNEFYEDRMKELMKNLDEISNEEDEKEKKKEKIDDIIDIGAKIGTVALGGMAIIDILSLIGDGIVSKNNDEIANEIAKLEDAGNQALNNVIDSYEKFIPLINEFNETYENLLDEYDDIDDEEVDAVILALKNVLLELYYQVPDIEDISLDDEDEYLQCESWLYFWAVLLYDGDQFREIYGVEILEDEPEHWNTIVSLTDEILKDKLDNSFSNIVNDFSETVIENYSEILELMSNSDWDDEFVEDMDRIIESNNKVVKLFEDTLDDITDYLDEEL